MSADAAPTRPWFAALCLAAGLALAAAACGSDGGNETAADTVADVAADTAADAANAAEGQADTDSTDASVGEYTEPPSDLTSDEVCALLPDDEVAELLEAEVISSEAGTRQSDCTWIYRLSGGPATSLQVQAMSMEQTGGLYGTEALEWSLDKAPEGSEVSEVASLDVPNGSYEFGVSTVVHVVDPAGRVITISAHSESPEDGRLALVEQVLDALSENHAA